MGSMPTTSPAEAFARELLEARADRFAPLIEDAPPALRLAQAASARHLATLVSATRATYVLLVGGGPAPIEVDEEGGRDAAAVEALSASLAAYRVLHIAGAFGHTGQIVTVERSPRVADGIRAAAERYAFAERVRVHAGDPLAVVSALNGPHDLAILAGREGEYERMREDLTRLIRIGGALTVVGASALAESDDGDDADPADAPRGGFLTHLATDERYLLSTGLDFAGVIAARIR